MSHLYTGPASILTASPDWQLSPPPGWLKLKSDGSFNTNNGKLGIGGLIHDPYGKLVMAYTAEVHAKHPLESKLLALQRGISHATELDALAIQIEGNYLGLITFVQNSANLTWGLVPTRQHTMNMLASLNTWTINYCKRTANKVVDLLAKYELPVVLEARASLPQHICNALNEDKERAEDYIKTFFHLPLETQPSSSSHSHGESSSRIHSRARKLCIRT